jgi:hypothetical protein
VGLAHFDDCLLQNQYNIQISERTCPLILDDEAVPLLGFWDSAATINCTTPDLTAGFYNVSINVFDSSLGLGNVLPNPNTVWQAINRLCAISCFHHHFIHFLFVHRHCFHDARLCSH